MKIILVAADGKGTETVYDGGVTERAMVHALQLLEALKATLIRGCPKCMAIDAGLCPGCEAATALIHRIYGGGHGARVAAEGITVPATATPGE